MDLPNQDNKLVDNILADMNSSDNKLVNETELENTLNQHSNNPNPTPSEEETYYEYEQVSTSTMDRLWIESKYPLIVALLVYLSNLTVVNTNMTKFVSQLGTGNSLNKYGVIVKSLMVGVVFYALTRFLL